MRIVTFEEIQVGDYLLINLEFRNEKPRYTTLEVLDVNEIQRSIDDFYVLVEYKQISDK